LTRLHLFLSFESVELNRPLPQAVLTGEL